ncbi:MAG: type I-B CRISPR-associated protein Cas5b [Candidatus Heimdallarchaeaceae archaeon]
METLVFDIKGEFAHFRAYDTTRENMTYPFPPRTAILGLIGGMLGFERNKYWVNSSLKDSSVALQILSPIWRSSIKINYLHTKYPIILPSSIKILMAKDPFAVTNKESRGFNAPVNLNVLRSVAYRIFFHSHDESLMDELHMRLKTRRYCYPPYLGHANMLAEINFIDKIPVKPMEKGEYEVRSLIPVSAIDTYLFSLDELGFTIIFNVPMALGYEHGRLYLKKSEHIILNTNLEEEVLKCHFKEKKVYQAEIQGETYNFTFLNR